MPESQTTVTGHLTTAVMHALLRAPQRSTGDLSGGLGQPADTGVAVFGQELSCHLLRQELSCHLLRQEPLVTHVPKSTYDP